MIISHAHKFIFLKTRKTAGTSIEMALARLCGPEDTLTRIVSESAEKKAELDYPGERNFRVPLARATWRDLVKIPANGWPCFSEHATARYVKTRVPENVWSDYFKFSFERDPWDRFVSQYHWNSRHRSWSIEDYFAKTTSFRRSNWDIYAIDDQPVVDFIGRYETLQDDLDSIAARLGLPKIELPRTKTTTRPAGSEARAVLSDEMQRKIAIACAREIALLEYGLDGHQGD